jgi:hypothetical protein
MVQIYFGNGSSTLALPEVIAKPYWFQQARNLEALQQARGKATAGNGNTRRTARETRPPAEFWKAAATATTVPEDNLVEGKRKNAAWKKRKRQRRWPELETFPAPVSMWPDWLARLEIYLSCVKVHVESLDVLCVTTRVSY